MNKPLLLSALVALGLTVAVQGCTSSNGSSTSSATKKICVGGEFSVCVCRNGESGTKECNADGTAFAQCKLQGAELCPGGEATFCEPGKDQFCQCANGNGGTKLCNDQGTEFGECLSEGASCTESDAGPPVSLEDKCPGKYVGLGAQTVTLNGDTTTSTDDGSGKEGGACALGKQSGDNVYELAATTTGQLTVEVTGEGGFDPMLYLRTACADAESQLACAETTGADGKETLRANVTKGTSYWLVVDGKSSTGKYKLTATVKSGSFCGDNKVDDGEACDDGNKTEGDGCSNNCQGISGDPMSANACPGQPVDVWPGKVVTGTGSTENAANTWKSGSTSCTKGTTNVALDHLYEVRAHKTGTLVAKITQASYNAMLLARNEGGCADDAAWTEPAANICSTPAATTMCGNCNAGSPSQDETIRFPVTSGKTYYVAASGALTGKGTYTISFEIQ